MEKIKLNEIRKMDRTAKLNELYERIMENRRNPEVTDDQFMSLLNDLYMMGFNEAADRAKECADFIDFETNLEN